ncbi:E3 ubiquitin-protein ligase RNF146 [Portunus trituberculatus]|uniref:E3 ubiquitin-protein ligase n=1 Tax=Portunus trituberculatus TaxID=210409 RepID=A0A5B7CYC6_PORTR|nr:E3 ubiquitin-protein ligase RNF146 [Portunus trituberculatus]
MENNYCKTWNMCISWWQYDERTSHELEAAYGSGQRACEVLVAGFLYIIDFDRMVQLRRNDPSRRRRIKRDLSSIPKKGVAGIKLPSQLEAELSALHTAAHAIHIPTHRDGDMVDSLSPAASNNNNNDLCPRTPTAPSNTPQTPHTPSAASSSSGSPDTSEPTHLHALTAESHHHHYHHHLPSHYQHIPHNQLHIPHHLTNNLSLNSEHGTFPLPAAGQHPRPPPLPSAIHPPPVLHHSTPASNGLRETSASVPSASTIPLADVEEAVYQMDQLSLLPDTPEFYPLDGSEETEQYHLTLSSEDDKEGRYRECTTCDAAWWCIFDGQPHCLLPSTQYHQESQGMQLQKPTGHNKNTSPSMKLDFIPLVN